MICNVKKHLLNESKNINKSKTNDIQLGKQNYFQKYQGELDILSVLISSTDKKVKNNNEQLLLEKGKGQKEEISKMTDNQLRDEVMTIFLAGHETTANALTWTLYLLSCHPKIEFKILDEIDAIINEKEVDDSNRKIIAVEDLSRLKYTEKVLMESMRLYPPSWAIGRQTIQDYSLNEK